MVSVIRNISGRIVSKKLRRVRVIREQTEFGEEIRPDCDPPFSVIEYQGDTVIVETIHEAGEPASWSEVKNPIYFDIQIGDQLYSFRGTLGAKRVGLDEKRRICLVVEDEKPYFVALDEEGKQVIRKTRKVRKLIPPEGDALAIRDGKLGILKLPAPEEIEGEEKFVDNLEEEFEDKKAGVKRKLKDVILKRDKFNLTLGDHYRTLEKLGVISHNRERL